MALLQLGQALPETVREFDVSAMKETLMELEGLLSYEM